MMNPNKMTCKPLSASTTLPTASKIMNSLTDMDNETQLSSPSQNEDENNHGKFIIEGEDSPAFHSVFWDIDAAKNLPIWVEPITESTNCIFGAFDPTVDEDVLVPLGGINGVLPG
jgi:hypothetical protein